MRANIKTQPAENKLYKDRGFHFCIRIGNWMLDCEGLKRWWCFTSVKPIANGTHGKRYGWKTLTFTKKQND